VSPFRFTGVHMRVGPDTSPGHSTSVLRLKSGALSWLQAKDAVNQTRASA